MSDSEEHFEVKPKNRTNRLTRQLHEDGYDDEGYGDEKDREELFRMSNLDRERILDERLTKREELLRKRDMLKHSNERSAHMDKKVEEMNRMKQQRLDRKQNHKDPEADFDNFQPHGRSDESDFDDPRPRKKLNTQPRPVKDASLDASHLQAEEDNYRQITDTDVDLVNRICLSRNFFVANASHLQLKKTIEHCLVRFTVKNGEKSEYVVGEIVNVIEKDEVYKVESKDITKCLIVRYDNDEKELRMSYISSKKMTSQELFNYIKTMKKYNLRVPTVGEIKHRFDNLQTMLNCKVTSKDIEHIVHQKNQLIKESSASPHEKLRIHKEEYSKLYQQYYEKPTPELKHRTKQLKREVEQLEEEISQRAKDHGEQPIVKVTKSDPYTFGSNKPKFGDSVMHTRTIPVLQNMWSENVRLEQDALPQKLQASRQTVDERQEDSLTRERGLFLMNEETKREFLQSYQRELDIDALVDALVKISV